MHHTMHVLDASDSHTFPDDFQPRYRRQIITRLTGMRIIISNLTRHDGICLSLCSLTSDSARLTLSRGRRLWPTYFNANSACAIFPSLGVITLFAAIQPLSATDAYKPQLLALSTAIFDLAPISYSCWTRFTRDFGLSQSSRRKDLCKPV